MPAWGAAAATAAGPSRVGTEASCLASACVTFACTLSPHRIILGGGVMESGILLPMVQEKTRALLNGYLAHPRIKERIEEFITAPGLGSRSGILGALALGRNLL